VAFVVALVANCHIFSGCVQGLSCAIMWRLFEARVSIGF
jgi:hypothetical protein